MHSVARFHHSERRYLVVVATGRSTWRSYCRCGRIGFRPRRVIDYDVRIRTLLVWLCDESNLASDLQSRRFVLQPRDEWPRCIVYCSLVSGCGVVTAEFHHTGPTGPDQTKSARTLSETRADPAGYPGLQQSLRTLSGRVRSGPSIVEFTYYRW